MAYDFFATPETDAAARMETGGSDEYPPMEVVDVKLCRKMEWQRNHARREAEMIRDVVVGFGKKQGVDVSDVVPVFMWESEVRLSAPNVQEHTTPTAPKP